MPHTMQDLVDDARWPLNDDGRDRIADSTLLKFGIYGLSEVLRVRPDLFTPTFTVGVSQFTDTFPLSDTYYMPIVNYATFRASLSDDEFTANGKAREFLLQMIGSVTGGA